MERSIAEDPVGVAARAARSVSIQPPKCLLCPLHVSSAQMADHLSCAHFAEELSEGLPDSPPFACKLCRHVALSKRALLIHVGGLHGRAKALLKEKLGDSAEVEIKQEEQEVIADPPSKDSGGPECKLCESLPILKSNVDFLRHLTDVHFLEEVSAEVPNERSNTNVEDSSSKTAAFKCDRCDYSAMNRLILINHYGVTHRLTVKLYFEAMGIQDEDWQTTEMFADVGKRPSSSEPRKCQPLRLPCRVCGVVLLENELITHLANSHFSDLVTSVPKQPPFKCPLCPHFSESYERCLKHFGFYHQKFQHESMVKAEEENHSFQHDDENSNQAILRDEALEEGSNSAKDESQVATPDLHAPPVVKGEPIRCLMCDDCKVVGVLMGDFTRHLIDVHFRRRLLREVVAHETPDKTKFGCPAGCDYLSTSKHQMVKHYGSKHKMVLQYYAEVVGEQQQQTNNYLSQTTTAPSTVGHNRQQQPTLHAQPPPGACGQNLHHLPQPHSDQAHQPSSMPQYHHHHHQQQYHYHHNQQEQHLAANNQRVPSSTPSSSNSYATGYGSIAEVIGEQAAIKTEQQQHAPYNARPQDDPNSFHDVGAATYSPNTVSYQSQMYQQHPLPPQHDTSSHHLHHQPPHVLEPTTPASISQDVPMSQNEVTPSAILPQTQPVQQTTLPVTQELKQEFPNLQQQPPSESPQPSIIESQQLPPSDGPQLPVIETKPSVGADQPPETLEQPASQVTPLSPPPAPPSVGSGNARLNSSASESDLASDDTCGSAPAVPSSSSTAVATPGGINSNLNDCKICSAKLKGSADYLKHLSKVHFKNHLLSMLAGSGLKCPWRGCGAEKKDQVTLALHYGAVHKVAFQLLNSENTQAHQEVSFLKNGIESSHDSNLFEILI